MLTARPQTFTPVVACIPDDKSCNWLRIDVGVEADAAQANELVCSAMARVETMCKQPIFASDFYGYGNGFSPKQELPSLNVTAVTKVEYKQVGNADWLVLDAAHYDWTETGELTFYPLAQLIPGVSRIRVSYRAGYAVDEVPADILQAIRLLIGRWYDVRTDEKKEVPSHAEWLLADYVLPIL